MNSTTVRNEDGRSVVHWFDSPAEFAEAADRDVARDARGDYLKHWTGETWEEARAHAARTGHVLHDDGGIARYIFAEVAREGARMQIITAAGHKADRDIDDFVSVEISHRIGLRSACYTCKAEGHHE